MFDDIASSSSERSNTISSPSTVSQGARPDPRDYIAAFNAIRDAILVVAPNGVILDMNRAACELLRVESARESQVDWSSLFPGVDASALLGRRREDPFVETSICASSGELIPVQLTVGEWRKDDSVSYIVAVRDIRPNRMAQRRLVERERMVAIRETMAALAHESRNALQRIQSCLTLIQLRGNVEIQQFIDDMQSAQDELHDLYEEIRAYAAPLQLDREEVDPEPLLVDVWRQLKLRWIPKNLTLELDRESGFDAASFADPARLSQVFRILLENAIEASPRDESIRIELAEDRWEGLPASRITVQDFGSGIPEKHKHRVFGLLFTTKKEGTGMGLAIAQRIMRAHDGEIVLDADQSKGCRISVVLPRE